MPKSSESPSSYSPLQIDTTSDSRLLLDTTHCAKHNSMASLAGYDHCGTIVRFHDETVPFEGIKADSPGAFAAEVATTKEPLLQRLFLSAKRGKEFLAVKCIHLMTGLDALPVLWGY